MDGVLGERSRILGMYFRVLVPERSRFESVSGGTTVPVTAPAVIEEEAVRAVFGNYLKIPPGSTSLRYEWVSPYAAVTDEAGTLYRLTIQKQPGLLWGPITLTIRVPDGFTISDASEGFSISGQVASVQTTFDRDVVLSLQYEP